VIDLAEKLNRALKAKKVGGRGGPGEPQGEVPCGS
jgi:hypothetical protein